MRVVFWLVLMAIFSPGWGVCSTKLFLSNGEWPPYLSKNLPYFGAASRIVTEAFAAVDIEVEYGFFPWKRSYKYAEKGRGEEHVWHGTLVWVYTEERAKSFHYSDVVIEESEVLFHLKNSPLQWKTIDDLRGKVIGGTAHTVYPLLEEAQKEGKLVIQRAGNYETLFRRLLSKRIDAVPQVSQVGRYFLHTELTVDEVEQITYSPTILDSRKYHLILSRNVDGNIRNLEAFNRGLQIIKENGTYDRIISELAMDQFAKKSR